MTRMDTQTNYSFITPTPAKVRSIAMNVSLCLSVCLSVCLCVLFARISRKPLGRTSQYYLCMFTVTAARSPSGGVAISYAFPVLRMTSRFQKWALWCVMCIPKRRDSRCHRNSRNYTVEVAETVTRTLPAPFQKHSLCGFTIDISPSNCRYRRQHFVSLHDTLL